MDQHVEGKGHRWNKSGIDESSDESSDHVALPVSKIFHSQPTIRSCFRDGTSLDTGIRNVLKGYTYPLEVDIINGKLVAINNRTLYCLKEATRLGGSRLVKVVVNRGRLRELDRNKYFASVTIRGQ